MILERLSLLAVILLAISSLLILLTQNWRWSIVSLALQYLGVFILISSVWPVGLAAVKLVAGWMAGALLGSSQQSPALVEEPRAGTATFIFRFLMAVLIWTLVFSLAPMIVTSIATPYPLTLGALLLVGMGLVHLGMTTRPLRVLIGLLTVLSGFELLYGALEKSVLVTGLLAIVTLGLALVGAFLLDRFSSSEEVA